MKSLFVIAILAVLLLSCVSFAVAEQERNQVSDSNEIEDENESELNDNSSDFVVSSNPNSEKNRARIGDEEVETEFEIEEGQENNQTKLKVNLSNGRKAEIKVMPSTASARAIERLGQLNFTIQLKEIKSGNETRLVYEVQAERHYKILALFKAKAQVKANVDTETGEVISTKKPWWAFLATSSD